VDGGGRNSWHDKIKQVKTNSQKCTNRIQQEYMVKYGGHPETNVRGQKI